MISDRLSLPDLILGVIVIVVGATVLFISFDYPAGTTALMGPGYMPRAMGAILIVLGGLVLVRGVAADAEGLPRYELRSLIFVMLAIVAFGYLISRLGFVPAVMAAAMLSSYANPHARLLPTLAVSVFLAFVTSVIFVWGLNISAELFQWPNF